MGLAGFDEYGQVDENPVVGLQGIEEAVLDLSDTLQNIVDAVDDEYPEVAKWANLLMSVQDQLLMAVNDAMAGDIEEAESIDATD